jgi:hypothetical protein
VFRKGNALTPPTVTVECSGLSFPRVQEQRSRTRLTWRQVEHFNPTQGRLGLTSTKDRQNAPTTSFALWYRHEAAEMGYPGQDPTLAGTMLKGGALRRE